MRNILTVAQENVETITLSISGGATVTGTVRSICPDGWIVMWATDGGESFWYLPQVLAVDFD